MRSQLVFFVGVIVAAGSTTAYAQHHGAARPQTNTAPTATATTPGTPGSTRGTGAGAGGTITFSLDKSRNAAAEGARARVVAGDCKGALDFFDEALRHSIDTTLYRDRGSCHEKLGNIYPAIDDYRAYLSQTPNAPDAETVRGRLDALIKDASQDMAQGLGGGGDFESEMRGGMVDGSTPTNTTADLKGSDDAASKDPNSLVAIEKDEDREKQAENSAVRKGKGFVLGVFLWPRYVATAYDFEFGQGFAARIGYSFSAASTVSIELGFMGQLSDGTASSASGFTGTANYEFRIPLDHYADNQLFVGAGAGYENLTRGEIGQAYSSFVGRGRFGYRHVFGPALALDVAADGGLMIIAPNDAPSGTKSADLGGFIGGIVALSVGF